MIVLEAPVVLGVSFKMYFDRAQTDRWCTAVAELSRRHPAITSGSAALFVLPGFTSLAETAKIFADTPVAVGAQDLFWQDRGAFTGEVSGPDLRDAGCALVEIGHAERRAILGETPLMFGAKVAAAIRNSLVPVLCIGESEPGTAEDAAAACIGQLEEILGGQRDGVLGPLILAYEPEWAIGAARAANPRHVSTVSALLREWLLGRNGFERSRVIYGGSAGPGLLSELGDAVDGLFLGRFAHDPAALETILDEVMLRVSGGRGRSAPGTASDPVAVHFPAVGG